MRTLKLLLVILLLNFTFSHPHLHASITDYTVTVSDAQGTIGQTMVPVYITLSKSGSGINEIKSIELELAYDTSKIAAAAVDLGGAVPSSWDKIVTSTANGINIKMSHAVISLPSDQGQLAIVYFNVSSDSDLVSPGDQIAMNLTIARLQSLDVTNKINGTFRIVLENQAPELDSIGDKTLNEGTTLDVTITASDPNGDNLSFTITNKPDFATFTDNGDGTALLELAPGYDAAGEYSNVKIKVEDDMTPPLSDEETIIITVNNVNRPPELDDIDSQHADEGQTVDVTVTATDPDDQNGDGLTFYLSDNPSFVTIENKGSGEAELHISPAFGDEGIYENVIVGVKDSGSPELSDEQAIIITVGDVNRPPLLNPIGDKELDEGTILDVTLTATDLDNGDVLSFTVLNKPAFAELTDNGDGTALLKLSPNFDRADTYSNVIIRVTDDGTPNLSDEESITITVNDVNRPPFAVNDTVFTDPGVEVDIAVLANDSDPDGDLPLVDSIVTLPQDGTAVTIESNTKIKYIPGTEFDVKDTFVYKITDGKNGFATATVTVWNSAATPWPLNFDPDYQFSVPIYGTATIDDVELDVGDWVGVFDAEGKCYGAGQYEQNKTKEFTFSVYAASSGHSLEGFESGEKMSFRFRVQGTDVDIPAVSIAIVDSKQVLAPKNYPAFSEGDLFYDGNPMQITLVNAQEKALILKPGWHFISFNIEPESKLVEDVFASILTGNTNYLEYVASNDKFWWSGAGGGGNLDEVDGYHSYHLKISNSCPVSGCELKITGLKIPPSHTFQLVVGWNNISYLLEYGAFAIFDGTGDKGVFAGIKDKILWIKGPEGKFCIGGTPGHGKLYLEPGKGLFIKMLESTPFQYEE